MAARIISIAFQSSKKFPLKKNEILDLPKLQQDCLRHGIKSVLGKGRISLAINGTSFLLFASGKIGRCYSPTFDNVDSFDVTVADFFWQNFANSCIKKLEVGKNRK